MCYCGSSAHLDTNAKIYGKEYGNGKVWLCDNWPECDGRVGTHPDSSPLGTIVDRETQKLRRQIHSIIDPLWQQQDISRKKARGSVYAWLQKLMNMSSKECHVGMFNKEQCIEALEKIALCPYEIRN